MLFDLLFRQNYLPASERVIIFLTFSIAVVFSLTVHEFAHAFCAYKLGDKTASVRGRMTFNPMAHFDVMGLICFLFLGFGWAKPVPINPYNFTNIKRDTFLVSISGITANLICAFISYPIAVLFGRIAGNHVVWQICFYLFLYLFQTNLVFMVFNLLPIYPLDGFNALASQLRYTNPYVVFMQKYGSLILLVLVIIFSSTNLFSWLVNIVGYPITALWNLILG